MKSAQVAKSYRPWTPIAAAALACAVHCYSINAINVISYANGSVSQSALEPSKMEVELFNQWDPQHCSVAMAESSQFATAEIQLMKIDDSAVDEFRLHANLQVSGTIHSSPGLGSPNPTIDKLKATLSIQFEYSATAYSLLDSVVSVQQNLVSIVNERYRKVSAFEEGTLVADVSGENLQSYPSYEPNPKMFFQLGYIGYANSLHHNSVDAGTLESGFLVDHFGELTITGSSGVGPLVLSPTLDGYEFSANLRTTFTRPMSLNVEQFYFTTDFYGLLQTDYVLCPDGGSSRLLMFIASFTFPIIRHGIRKQKRSLDPRN